VPTATPAAITRPCDPPGNVGTRPAAQDEPLKRSQFPEKSNAHTLLCEVAATEVRTTIFVMRRGGTATCRHLMPFQCSTMLPVLAPVGPTAHASPRAIAVTALSWTSSL
jgi:hypothetical protein